VPSVRIVKTWLLGRQQLLLTTSCLPLGDQLGQNASRVGFVSRTGRPPFTLTTHTAESSPPRSLSNAIHFPRGENVASPLIRPPATRVRMAVPSARLSTMSQLATNP